LEPVKEPAWLYKYTNTWIQHNYTNETKNTDKAKCEYWLSTVLRYIHFKWNSSAETRSSILWELWVREHKKVLKY
jgi:hypothetical protein